MKRFFYLFIIAALICGLFGCSDASSTADEPTTAEQTTSESQTTEPTEAPSTEPPTTEPPTTQAPVTEPAEPTVYLYDELGFRLTFPTHWEGRFNIEGELLTEGLTVSADGEKVFTLFPVRNIPGAYERSMELYADEYQFFNESFDCSFFIKLHGEFPEDLSWNSTGMTGTEPKALWDAKYLFSYNGEDFYDMVAAEQGYMRRGYYNTVLYPYEETQTYYNYRLGIKLDIPEFLVGKCITPSKGNIGISEYELSPLDGTGDLAYFYVYNSRIGHNETIYPADEDPYPLMNKERGYEANIAIDCQDTRTYYIHLPNLFVNFGDADQVKLNTIRQQIYDNLGSIFSMIE